jgi:hypothetical protein
VVWSELTTWHNVIYKQPRSSLKVAAALVGVASAGKWYVKRIFKIFIAA